VLHQLAGERAEIALALGRGQHALEVAARLGGAAGAVEVHRLVEQQLRRRALDLGRDLAEQRGGARQGVRIAAIEQQGQRVAARVPPPRIDGDRGLVGSERAGGVAGVLREQAAHVLGVAAIDGRQVLALERGDDPPGLVVALAVDQRARHAEPHADRPVGARRTTAVTAASASGTACGGG
jgi:hypothetical protein